MRQIKSSDIEYVQKCMAREPHTTNKSIDQLRSDLEDHALAVNYEYQRNYILDETEASKFVESVFLGCPIPEVQFFQDSMGLYEIIDGQQRITALIKFLKNEYSLRGLNKLKFLNGLKFENLPPELGRKYKSYNLTVKVMKDTPDEDDYKFFVFERLNKGSKRLNQQEIRNCIYRGPFMNLLRKMALREEVESITPDIKNGDMRFERTEFLLKVISNCENWDKLQHQERETMNQYLIKVQNADDATLNKIEKKYMSAITILVEHIGISAFITLSKKTGGGKTSKINVAAFLTTIILYFDKRIIAQNSDKIRNAINGLISSAEYENLTRPFSDFKENVMGRVELMKMAIDEAIGNVTATRRLFSIGEKELLWNHSVEQYGIVICSICGNEILDILSCETDHTVPFSKGGKTTIENAQLTHRLCNRMKSNSERYSFRDGEAGEGEDSEYIGSDE